jgi:hypothetical protein
MVPKPYFDVAVFEKCIGKEILTPELKDADLHWRRLAVK